MKDNTFQAEVGQIIKSKDFGHIESDYIIGKVIDITSYGMIHADIIQRVSDNKDITGKYDDESFTTRQNGEYHLDIVTGPRISLNA